MEQPGQTSAAPAQVLEYAQLATGTGIRRVELWQYLRTPLALLTAVLMSVTSFWLFTQNNDFPLHYHPDEPSKVQQLLDPSQYRNFNHPVLLLEAANLYWHWSGQAEGFRSGVDRYGESLRAAIAGRTTSALLAAAGVFALAMASYAAYGFAGLLIGGSAMMLCPPLLVYSHYFKEDASLVAGVMIALLGARLILSGRSEWTQMLAAIVVGVGCGAAASAKYVGAVTLVPCLVVLAIAGARNWTAWPIRIFTFILVTTATAVFINQRGFADWKTLQIARGVQESIVEEYDHGTGGHYGVALAQPNAYCLGIAASETMPHLWALGGAGTIWLIWRRRISRWGIVVAVFLLTWVAALSMNPIPFGRYALPITVLGYFALSQLTSAAAADLSARPRVALPAIGAALVLILSLGAMRCARINGQFLDDSRQRLYEWVAENLPRNSPVLAESYTSLGQGGDPLRFPKQNWRQPNVNQQFFASRYGSIDRVARSGYDYVAVAAPNYDRFFAPGVYQMGNPGTPPRERQFYADLFEKGELVWSARPEPDTHSYLNPDLSVYKISHLRR